MLVKRHPVTALRVALKKARHILRHRTIDREAVPVLTVEQIGPRRYRTPEGYLYCESVPAARTGDMVYARSELPLEPGPDGLIRVVRDAEALFAPTTLASYNGKPVVVEHPESENVGADNYDRLGRQIVGTVLNPRRGEGEDADVMLVDLLIMSKRAIEDIDAGKREVSAGYEADYEQVGPGLARQLNIIGNHVALVEKGRCGPRCAIGDHQPKELQDMKKQRSKVLSERIRAIFADAAEEAVTTMGEAPGLTDDEPDGDEGGTHIHIHTNGGGMAGAPGAAMPPGGGTGDPSNPDVPNVQTQDDPVESRFQKIEALLAQIAAKVGVSAGGESPTNDGGDKVTPPNVPNEGDAPGGGDAMAGADDDVEGEITSKDAMPDEVEALKKVKTGDSAAFETMWRQVVADAEVLVPGFRVPTFDAKVTRRRTVDNICALRRSVLSHMAGTGDGARMIDGVAPGGFNAQSATCVEVAGVFRAAAAARRLINNTVATRDAERVPGQLVPSRRPITPADLNRLHREYHAKQAS